MEETYGTTVERVKSTAIDDANTKLSMNKLNRFSVASQLAAIRTPIFTTSAQGSMGWFALESARARENLLSMKVFFLSL